MTRVLVVAESAVVRAGLESLVRAAGFEVVGTGSSRDAIAGRAASMGADAILADAGQDSDSTAIASLASGPPAVLLAGPEVDPADALRHGIRALLPRDAGQDEIAAAIQAAVAGLVALTADVAGIALPLYTGRLVDEAIEPLTAREIEVLVMVAEGEGNKVIARKLAISEHTVKFHVGSIMGKLNASSRTEAVTLGFRRGLIML